MQLQHPQLDLLAVAYFGQEWEEVAATPEGVVRAFAAIRGNDATRALIEEIDTVLAAAASEDELATLWVDSLQSSFVVSSTGMTYRRWFEHLREVLRTSAAEG